MDPSRRLKRLIRCFLGHPRRRQRPQLLVYPRQQFLGDMAVPLLGAFKDLREVTHPGVGQKPSPERQRLQAYVTVLADKTAVCRRWDW